MAKITNFVYCLNAEQVPAPNGKGSVINAMGVFSVLTPEFIPSAFTFSIVFSLVDLEFDKPNDMKIVFRERTSGKEVFHPQDVHIPAAPENLSKPFPPESLGYNLSMDFRNVPLECEGFYDMEISLSGERLGTYPIYVKGKRHGSA